MRTLAVSVLVCLVADATLAGLLALSAELAWLLWAGSLVCLTLGFLAGWASRMATSEVQE